MKLTQKQEDFVKQIARENNLQGCEISLSPGSKKDENYLGCITRVTLSKENKKLSLIMKTGLCDDNKNTPEIVKNMYTREMDVYTILFKEFAAFEDKYNIANKFTLYPKFYGSIGDDTLFLQDMKEDDYQMWNKHIPMNSAHIEKIVGEYGRYHAISLAIKMKEPKLFKKLCDIFRNTTEEQYKGKEEELVPLFKALMKNLHMSVENDLVAREHLQKYGEILSSGVLIKTDPKELCVISHGDCWCNNFLFKYQDKNNPIKPDDIKILDWQMAKCEGPAADLVYFIVCNGSKDILDNYKYYLKLYYNVLTQKLKEFGCEVEDVFTYDGLEAQFSLYCKKMLTTFAVLMRIVVCSPDEAPDVYGGFGDSEKMNDVVDFQLSNMDEYYQRLGVIVKFMSDNNMLC